MNSATKPVPEAPKNLPPKRARPPSKPTTSTPSTSAPSGTTTANQTSLAQHSNSPHRRDRVSREVFLLTGGVTPPPLMPVLPHATHAKPVQKRGWVWRSFKNPARNDALQLSHWTRAAAPASEYPFARFNKPIRMIRYSDAEYRTVLAALLPLNIAPGEVDKLKAKANGKAPRKEKAAEGDGKAASASSNLASTTQPSGANADKEKVSDSSNAPKVSTKNTTRASSTAAIVPAEPRPSPPSPIPQREHATRRSSPNIAQPVASTPSQSPRASPPSSPTASPSLPSTQGNLKNGIHYVHPQKPWSKLETDTLFELCERFDLRFVVVHDRWPDQFEPRSLDELKDRFYSVSKRLIEHRTKLNSNYISTLPTVLQKHCQAINMNPFDYEYECIRKNQLLWQYGRSKAELREEEETVREARRIEANRKRAAKERQRLAKLLTPAGDIAMTMNGKQGVDQALAAAASSMPQKTFPHRKVLSGAYARSSMIYTPISQSSRVAKRIDAALVELGVGTRPTPTTIVVDNFDLLRMDILSYIELQRTVLRKEEDTHLLRVKLAKLKGETPPAPPAGVTLSHKKRRAEDLEVGSLFGGPSTKQQKLA